MVVKQYVVTYTSMVIEADNEEDAIARAEDGGGGHWEATEIIPETIESLCERLDVTLIRAQPLGSLWPEGKVAVYHMAAAAIGNSWVDATDLTEIEARINRARSLGYQSPFVKGNY